MKDCQGVMKMGSRFGACMQANSAMGAEMPPETSPEYMKIYEMGVMLKSVHQSSIESGAPPELISVTKKDIPASEFSLPKEYKIVPASAFWITGP